MRLVMPHRGPLHALRWREIVWQPWRGRRKEIFSTGLPAVDQLLPEGGLPRAAMHEILADPRHGLPLFFPTLLARAAGGKDHGTAIFWCDPEGTIYPPALAAAGIALERLYLLRPRTQQDLIWAMAESLRCPGVAAAIAAPRGLGRIEARRLQLAAETGGGIGLLLRAMLPNGRAPVHHAAHTRWLVAPVVGNRTVQRWRIRLIHCHGGNIEQTVILEHCRETNSVCAAVELAHRLVVPKIALA